MQETLEFLKRIWPDEGWYCLATRSSYGYSHLVFQTIEEAASAAESNADKDIYFAVGSLKEKQVWNPNKIDKKENKPGAYEWRTHANMHKFKVLIVDIDCGEGKDYQTQKDALLALKTFCDDSKIPKPTIVNSGWGIHAYWHLNETISGEDFQRIGNKLKVVFEHHKLKFDPTATSDMSRVLRVAGTSNCKRDPVKPVKVIKWSEVQLTPSKVEHNLDFIIEKNGLSLPKAKPSKEVSSVFDGVTTLNDKIANKDLDLIIDRCPQMHRALKTDADVGYAMRCSVISICKLTTQNDYEALFDNVQDEVLAREQAEGIVVSSISDNPHTCERFEQQNAGGCDGCAFKGKVKSPITLGIVELSNQPELVKSEDSLPLPQEVLDTIPVWKRGKPRFDLPAGFRISPQGIVRDATSEDETASPKLVVPGKFYPYDNAQGPDGALYFSCYLQTGHIEHQEIKIPTRLLGDPKALAAELCARGAIVTSANANDLVKYMASYANIINAKLRPTEQHNQLGWVNSKVETPGIHTEIDPEKFVLPYNIIHKDGFANAIPSKRLSNVAVNFGECGSIEEWKKVINIYAQRGYEGYAFGALSGFGSLLMQFTEYEGAIVSMVGDSGSGKSTVLKIINSLFAKPNSYLTQSDTINAFFGMIGTYGSVAVTADELTDLPPEVVSKIAYSISQGRDKFAMGADRTIKENDSTWKLLLVSSSNRSLLTKLAEFKKESAAEAYRIFEFPLNSHQHKLSKREAEVMFSPLSRNYGHAGKLYVKHILNNLPRVKQMIEDMRHEIDDRVNAIGPERYWTIAVCVNLVGGLLAKEIGLIDFDMESIKTWACDQIENMRGDTVENSRGSVGTVAAYLSNSIGNTITVGGDGSKSKAFYCIKEPTQKLWNRYEAERGLMYIDKAEFRSFVVQGGGDFGKVLQELQNSGILVSREKHIVLTKGSSISNSGQVRTIVINIGHPAMAGVETPLLKVA